MSDQRDRAAFRLYLWRLRDGHAGVPAIGRVLSAAGGLMANQGRARTPSDMASQQGSWIEPGVGR
jgi:hypothetical protein